MKNAAVVVASLALASAASAQMRITEWMYSGSDGEFIEFTNVGNAPIDMTGWSFDDDSRFPTAVSLSAFGVVAAGESVLLCEPDAATLRAGWGLAASVKIIGNNAANLGRNDEINLFDASNALVDRLTYGDQNFPGSIRTQNESGSTEFANLGANTIMTWDSALEGDIYGSYVSVNFDLGNPGYYTLVPAPSALAVLGLGSLAAGRRRRA